MERDWKERRLELALAYGERNRHGDIIPEFTPPL